MSEKTKRDDRENIGSHKRAHEIMDKNFLGIEEVSEHLGVNFTSKQLEILQKIPLTEAVLQKCKDTHVLVAGYPVTILDIRRKVPELFYQDQREVWSYDEEFFAKNERVDLQWYLFRKDVLPESIQKSYREQLQLLAENETVPRACELIYGIILYYLNTGNYLLECLYARCCDVASDGCRVHVGYFDSRGVKVSSWWGDSQFDFIGLASVQKS